MSEQTSMEDILAVNNPDIAPGSKTDEKPEEKVEAETPEPEEKADSSDAGETEAKESKDDKAEDKPAKADTVPHEALHAERERRKDLEKRFNELTSQVGALLPHLAKDGAKPKADEKAGVSFNEDPEGFITGKLTQIEQAARQEAATRFFDMSEASARRRHGSETFQTALDWFKQAAQSEPALIQKLNQQPDPGEWIMTTYQKASDVAKVSAPGYWENREKELRAQWEAEQAKAAEEAAQEAAEAEPAPRPRKSLAKARNTGGRTSTKAFTGPTSIHEILPDKRG